jgi:hypothetical protein
MTDLFGLKQQTLRTNDLKEAAALVDAADLQPLY